MKVVIKRVIGFKEFVYKIGDVVDVEKDVAEKWIEASIAEKHVAKKRNKRNAKKPVSAK